jgi:hypothetical protein
MHRTADLACLPLGVERVRLGQGVGIGLQHRAELPVHAGDAVEVLLGDRAGRLRALGHRVLKSVDGRLLEREAATARQPTIGR